MILERITGSPEVTNDGVTIAREIHLRDPFENMGAQLVKEAAIKTNDTVGDGTTTAIVLAEAIVRQGMTAIAGGGNPVLVKRGIDVAVARLVEHLAGVAHPMRTQEDFARVASISANDDESSATRSPEPSTRSARAASSPSRTPPSSGSTSSSSRTSSSTTATSRRTWSPTSAGSRRFSRTATSC